MTIKGIVVGMNEENMTASVHYGDESYVEVPVNQTYRLGDYICVFNAEDYLPIGTPWHEGVPEEDIRPTFDW